MKVISTGDLNNSALVDIFKDNQLRAEIIVVNPAEPALGLEEDSYVRVSYPDNKEVIFWMRPKECLLRMRTVLLDRKELDLLEKQAKLVKVDLDWEEKMAFINQNAGAFGSLNSNLLGLVVDYALPYRTGVLDETILLAGENLLRGAEVAWCYIESKVKRVRAKQI